MDEGILSLAIILFLAIGVMSFWVLFQINVLFGLIFGIIFGYLVVTVMLDWINKLESK